mgnify:CR=1 FL=1
MKTCCGKRRCIAVSECDECPATTTLLQNDRTMRIEAAAKDLIAYSDLGRPEYADWDAKFDALAKALEEPLNEIEVLQTARIAGETMIEPEDDDSYEDAPECPRCRGDGQDPFTDYLLPCPLCQGEQQP